MGGIAALPNDGKPMTVVQAKFAVFYGEPDQKRGPGWYWTVVPGPGEPLNLNPGAGGLRRFGKSLIS